MGIFDRRNGKDSDHHYPGERYEVRDWLDDDGCFLFGKHVGEELSEVAREDPNYLEWIVEEAESIRGKEREVVKAALRFVEWGKDRRRR